MEKNNKKNVIIILFDHLTMKCIFNEYSFEHYLHLMIKGVMKALLKVNHGIDKILQLHLIL